MSALNVAVCDDRWAEMFPGRLPYRVIDAPEPCHYCGRPGCTIYIRVAVDGG